MQSPAERIHLIERSLRCFVYGLLSLIPFVGLGFAALTIRLHFKTWAEPGDRWNPARKYLVAGFCLAWLGVLVSVGGMALFVVILIKRYEF
ncbi:MAG TPA: hypothetical protein VJW76_13170 [Verrucomicrobiae bacterium]|nr:hypothetical protein [Verrucomicrobiae bacterium]